MRYIRNSFQGESHAGAGLHEGASPLNVQAVVNPLSKAAQRMAPILEWLRSSFDASVKVLCYH